MPTITNGPGAVQTAYVSYRSLELTDPVLQLYWPNAFQATPDVMAAYLNITATNQPDTPVNIIVLPDARQVSVGQNFIIANTSSSASFIVENFSRDDEWTIYNGTQEGDADVNTYYFILSDNTTSGGTWIMSGFGATKIAPDAGQLASNHGVVAHSGLLYTNAPVVIQASEPLLINSIDDNATTYVWTTGSGDITLDPLADLNMENGFYFCLNTYQSGGQVTITDSHGYLIDGQTTKIVNPQQSLMVILSRQGDGPSYQYQWVTVGYAPASSTAFTISTVPITGGSVVLNLTQLAAQMIILTGTLTSNATVVFQNLASEWQVVNNTTGSFTVELNVIGFGSPQTLPQGDSLIYYNNAGILNVIPTSSSAGTVTSVAVASPGNTLAVTGSPITTSGTINLDLNTVAIVNGGTGQTGKTAAFDALSPTTTAGDLITSNGTDNIRLALGGAETVLGVSGGALAYVPGLPIAGIANGSMAYYNGANWVALAAGTDGFVLKMAGGIPTWSAP